MRNPIVLADYPANMGLVVFVTLGIIGFAATAFSFAFSKKPGDERTAKLMFAVMGIGLLIWSYAIWRDSFRHT